MMPMKLNVLADRLALTHICGELDKEASGVYTGDLLSWVMSHVEAGDVWITIMSNVNVAAVASLTEAACVILAESVQPDEETMQAAKEKNVTIFSDSRSAYQLCCCLGAILSDG